MIDKGLKLEIMSTVRRAMQEVLEDADEVWLTPKQVTEQFSMFSRDWLARHGELLPRERASYIDKDGMEKFTGWAYPKHKIQRLIRDRELHGLRIKGNIV